MMIKGSRTFFLLSVLVFMLLSFAGSETPEEAKKRKAWLVKKHIKRLKKVEGAIKLVGGRGEYEGKCPWSLFIILYFYDFEIIC